MSLSKAGIRTSYSLLFCFFCLFLFACVSCIGIQNIRKTENTTENSEGRELMLMTFNIRAGGGTKNPDMSPYDVEATDKNLDKIAEVVKFVNPDVVGLQEVRGFSQAAHIAKESNLNFVYAPHGGRNSWWGLAILSKYKIKEYKTSSVHYGWDPRIALSCKIEINDKIVEVINIHYHIGDFTQQVSSTTDLIEKTNEPLLLMGDLNRKVRHPDLKPIRDKLVDTCSIINTEGARIAEKRGTFGAASSYRIDHIYIDVKSFLVIDVGVVSFVDPKSFKIWDWLNPNTLVNPDPSIFPIEYTTASDHLAYFAKVNLKQ